MHERPYGTIAFETAFQLYPRARSICKLLRRLSALICGSRREEARNRDVEAEARGD